MSKPISGLKNNIGLHNSTGKISGKALHLVYTSLASTTLSISEFALFAVFWATLRFFVYLGSNNYYISFFSDVREKLAEKKWHNPVFSTILVTAFAYSALSFVFFFGLFKCFYVSLSGALAVFSGVLLKCLAEFSKANHSVFIAVISEDLTLNTVLLGSLLFLPENPTILFISQWTLIAYAIAMIVSYVGIVRKFGLKWLPNINFPPTLFTFFKTGFDLTIYRGHEMTAFFLIRTVGKYFVASTHILLQFYNIVKLYVIATISGYQSKITLDSITKWTITTIKELYFKVLKRSLLLFAVGIILGFALKTPMIKFFFPNYLEIAPKVNIMLVIGIIMYVFEPLHYILIYNKLIHNKKRINKLLALALLALSCLSILSINPFFWFYLMISYTLIIQFLFVLQKVKSLKE
jgi:O-antigen/teichoic acid export membrane protein